jgi:hypothetical protein
MGAGNQGGGSSAEDVEIRRAFSADKTKTAKDARDYFRDRDSGKLAANAYLNSEAPGSGGQSNRDILERQLGNQGLSLEGQNFVRYDEQGNRGTVGGINQKGNFWGSADLSGVNSPSYLAQSAEGGSRDRRYGSNAEAMSQGTLDPRIQDSLIDLVTYNPTGTVTGMSSQQVYNPTSLFPGDPNRTFNMDTGFYETDESIGFDDTSPSLLGRAARGATDFIGQGGTMGAVTKGLGALGDKSSNLSDEVTSSGITNALMSGFDKSQQDRQAGLYDNRGVKVAGPFSGSAINPFTNMNIDPTRMSQQGPNFTPPPVQFDASGSPVPFDGGNRISKPLGIGTLPAKKPLSNTGEMPVYDAFGNSTIFMGQGPGREDTGIPLDFAERDVQDMLDSAASADANVARIPYTDPGAYTFAPPFGMEEAMGQFPASPIAPISFIPTDISVSPNADMITDRPTFAFQDENFGRDSDVTDFRDYSGLNDSNLSLYQDLDTPPPEKTVSPYGGQEFPFLDRERPSFPVPEKTVSSYGGQEFNELERLADTARAKRLAKLGAATGFENNMPLEQEGPFVNRDSRIRDAMAPDGLDDNMYNDGSEMLDLSETLDPSGANVGVGGDGGGPVQCPPGYEPMILESGETVCVPITEDEEVMDEGEVITAPPVTRPTISDSPYTPQAVSNIAPYRLQPGSSGGGLADILQLQNYPTIV